MGDLEYLFYCLMVDFVIYIIIIVSEWLIIYLEDLECFVVLVDGVVLDVLRLLYNKFCWWMCNNLVE